MTLQEFLNKNIVENITKEVVISDRLKNEKTGEYYKFKIKALTCKQYEDIVKKATNIDIKGKVFFDSAAFKEDIIINFTLNPNFKDAESIKSVGCLKPKEYLNKILLGGEAELLSKEILNLSGYGKNINEYVEEVKN